MLILKFFPIPKFFIHEKSSFANNFTARASAGSVIDIGRDSMFSYDIEMYAGDGHSILMWNHMKE